MKTLHIILITFSAIIGLITGCTGSAMKAECNRFVAWVAPAKNSYIQEHQVFPVPEHLKQLALHHMPRVWVYPESWHPISFEDYLTKSKLVRRSDGKILMVSPTAETIAGLSQEAQCDAYLDADDVLPVSPAPLYIQVFQDRSPVKDSESWTYIKYNPVFNWSGLANRISWISHLGAFFTGGNKERWHRLDVHTGAVLVFDSQYRFRMMTLAQHNHQQTFIAEKDFPADRKPTLVAAARSNELYLDKGESTALEHRVVPFFNKAAFLIDPKQKPWLWGLDKTFGRKAGGKEVRFYGVFLDPKHPLADFAGLLAPPRRLFGLYIGRDGPPGYNYYAPPSYIPLPDFAAVGFWQAGNMELLGEVSPYLKNREETEWDGILKIMRRRLRNALMEE